MFVENGIKPVWVFDGKPPDLKLGELSRRKKAKLEAQAKLEDAQEEGKVEENLALDFTKITMEFVSYKKNNEEDRRDTVIYDLETASASATG